MGDNEVKGPPVQPQLGLWDAVSIMVGIVIGATIYESPPLIFNNVNSPAMGLGVWVLGGVLSLIGALCYAELASTYPRMGGDYVYLSRAFGPWVGFLFGWAQLAVVITASIGSMAFIFARYASQFWRDGPDPVVYAVAAVVVLSTMNVAGVVLGKGTQNALSLTKVIGLGAIVIAGVCWRQPEAFIAPVESRPGADFGLAMIFVLYGYGGWNDMAFVAAELRDRRNIPRALLLGTLLITVIYVAVNAAYILALGFEGARSFEPPVAARILTNLAGQRGGQLMSVLVMVSALSAVNGLIFTGSRVYSSLGSDWTIFAFLGRWNQRLGSPLWSLLAQGAIGVTMILAVGTQTGRDVIDGILTGAGRYVLPGVGLGPLPWQKYYGGFGTLVAGTAPVFWIFFLLTGISLFALRQRDRDIERPFSVPLFPVLPLIFCCTCFYMLYSALSYAKALSLLGFVPLAVGLVLYYLSPHRPVAEAPPKESSFPAERPTARIGDETAIIASSYNIRQPSGPGEKTDSRPDEM